MLKKVAKRHTKFWIFFSFFCKPMICGYNSQGTKLAHHQWVFCHLLKRSSIVNTFFKEREEKNSCGRNISPDLQLQSSSNGQSFPGIFYMKLITKCRQMVPGDPKLHCEQTRRSQWLHHHGEPHICSQTLLAHLATGINNTGERILCCYCYFIKGQTLSKHDSS